MALIHILFLPFLLFITRPEIKLPADPNIFSGNEGQVHFISVAPLETIEASTKHLGGALDIRDRSFYFSTKVTSFDGFNGGLQKEHFNENYMESSIYPQATFKGKIIEAVDFMSDGTYPVRAKGELTIHGISVERIITGKLTVKGNSILIEGAFAVPLSDHNIVIPKIVEMKIDQEVQVDMKIELSRNQ